MTLSHLSICHSKHSIEETSEKGVWHKSTVIYTVCEQFFGERKGDLCWRSEMLSIFLFFSNLKQHAYARIDNFNLILDG